MCWQRVLSCQVCFLQESPFYFPPDVCSCFCSFFSRSLIPLLGWCFSCSGRWSSHKASKAQGHWWEWYCLQEEGCPENSYSLWFAGMGNLIKVLTRDIDHNAAHFFLDFESKSLSPSQLVHMKWYEEGCLYLLQWRLGDSVANLQIEKGLHVVWFFCLCFCVFVVCFFFSVGAKPPSCYCVNFLFLCLVILGLCGQWCPSICLQIK